MLLKSARWHELPHPSENGFSRQPMFQVATDNPRSNAPVLDRKLAFLIPVILKY